MGLTPSDDENRFVPLAWVNQHDYGYGAGSLWYSWKLPYTSGVEIYKVLGTHLIDLAEFNHKAVYQLCRSPKESAARVYTLSNYGGLLGIYFFGGALHPNWWSTLNLFFIAFLILSLIGAAENSQISNTEVTGVDEQSLPIYTVLVPVYKGRGNSILIQALSRLDYPHEKLDILILREKFSYYCSIVHIHPIYLYSW